MSTLVELFLKYGGLTIWLFILAIPPQIWNNFKTKKYTSGSLWTWILFVVAYLLFGIYMLAKQEYIAAVGQGAGFVLSLIVIIQSFTYKKE